MFIFMWMRVCGRVGVLHYASCGWMREVMNIHNSLRTTNTINIGIKRPETYHQLYQLYQVYQLYWLKPHRNDLSTRGIHPSAKIWGKRARCSSMFNGSIGTIYKLFQETISCTFIYEWYGMPYTYVYTCIHIYIYVTRHNTHVVFCVYIYTQVYIYRLMISFVWWLQLFLFHPTIQLGHVSWKLRFRLEPATSAEARATAWPPVMVFSAMRGYLSVCVNIYIVT